ncbi:MAG TPA: hypothetical protein VHO25_09545 [Polyangiaceae bacterium]|nr:hypothetical protein [Polyangiaceae bacterium]
MRLWVLLLVFSMGCVACASSREETEAPTDQPQSAIRIGGGNGSRCDIAIQIFAPNERTGVQAEYDWLQKNRAGYKVVKRAGVDCAGVATHQLTIVMPDGRQQDVFFDPSDFIGKL